MIEVEVCVVGAGFAGIGAAIKLLERGERDFVVLDQATEIGGTWRDNTYPGCACDIPSHLYSFSFAPYAGWSRMYPTQPEIQAYLLRVVADFGLAPYLRLGCGVTGAHWDASSLPPSSGGGPGRGAGRWIIRTTGETYAARWLILALGGLSRPSIPYLPGIARFRGHSFHSQRWDHAYDLAGKRVAVIGTGASAIQFVPAIQPSLAKLDLYQRTPPWILPKPDRPISPFERAIYANVPGARWAFRQSIFVRHEARALAFTRRNSLMDWGEGQARAHLAAQVADPQLRSKLTPGYRMGCKRVLISNDYYPALTRPNVELVTTGIGEVTETGIRDAEGAERPVDCIVYGTGFRTQEFLAPVKVTVEGRDLVASAKERGGVWLGTMASGFPNLFFMTGPNSGLGHNSMIFIIESQLNLVMSVLRQAKARNAATVAPRPEAEERFNRWVATRTEGTVWTSGCRSWYLDENGRNTAIWPGFTVDFWRRTRKAWAEDYVWR